MAGAIIPVFAGVVALLVGLKGFSEEGLQLTTKKRLNGTPGRVVGTICVIIAIAFFGLAALTLVM